MPETHATIRVVTERDIPELAALWSDAFPGVRGPDERARELREGMAYGTLSDCRVLEIDDRLAGALRAYRLELHVRGRTYPTLGLAGVAVAPDFRRRGIGRRICVDALREGRRRGDVLSLLYPFRVSFYAGMGYALAGELHHCRFRPEQLPLYAGWDKVARAEEGDHADVRALYHRVAARSSGMLERSRSAWRAHLNARRRIYLYRPDTNEGVTGYAIVAAGPRRNRATLHVQELLWEDQESYRALLGWLSAQRDQYARVTYDALPSEELHRHFAHPRTERARAARGLWFETARVLRGPMLRLLDVGALQGKGLAEELGVLDRELPENQGRWRGGKRVGTDAAAGDNCLTIDDAARAFLAGSLPGQAPAPDGWRPIVAGDPFRLLDEF